MPATLKAYQDAAAAVANIIAQWSPHWPKPSPKIIRYDNGSKTYRGIDGRGVEMPWDIGGHSRVPDLGTPEVFAASYERYSADAVRLASKQSKRGLKHALFWAEREKASIVQARDYWVEVERITAASGIVAAEKAKTDARDALRDLIEATMSTEENTLSGVVIKAQALTAWAKVEPFYQAVNPRAQAWACNLAQTIMRHGGAV